MNFIIWNLLYYDYLSKYELSEAKQIYPLLFLPQVVEG